MQQLLLIPIYVHTNLFFHLPLIYRIILITAVNTHVRQVVPQTAIYPTNEICISMDANPIRPTTSAMPFIKAKFTSPTPLKTSCNMNRTKKYIKTGREFQRSSANRKNLGFCYKYANNTSAERKKYYQHNYRKANGKFNALPITYPYSLFLPAPTFCPVKTTPLC